MHLIHASTVTEAAYLDYITEWEAAQERIVPGAIARKGQAFADVTQRWAAEECEAISAQGLVPATLYFLASGERLLGAIHHRHRLNATLEHIGGHIGYGIRPSERGKGYAPHMLHLLLRQLAGQGLAQVLITCDDNNLGSIRTIERNQGRLENCVLNEGILKRRYWIDLSHLCKEASDVHNS